MTARRSLSGPFPYPRGASDAAPAVDLQGDARDEGGLVRGEIEGGAGDVVGPGEAPEGNRRHEAGAMLGRVAAHEIRQHGRIPGDGAEGVDADLLRRQLDRHGFRERDHRALAAVVPGEPGTRP